MEDSSSESSIEIIVRGCRNRLTLSTDNLKLATALIYIVLILHVIGFALPNWYKIDLHQTTIGNNTIENEIYFVGLWRDCLCENEMDSNECKCASKNGFTGFLKTVQILEIIGLAGYIMSAVICVVLLCLRQHDRRMKGLNLIIVTCSGACAIAAAIVFERENVGLEYKDSFNYIVSISPDKDGNIYPEVRSNLSTSFILCTTAAGLCLFCVPLLLIDLCNRGPPPAREEMRLIHVEHFAEGPFTIRQAQRQNAQTNGLQSLP